MTGCAVKGDASLRSGTLQSRAIGHFNRPAHQAAGAAGQKAIDSIARSPKRHRVGPKAAIRDANGVIVAPRRCPPADIPLRISRTLTGGWLRLRRVLRS